MRVTYIAPDKRWVPEIKLFVEHGEEVEMPDEMALRAIEQEEVWRREETKAQRDQRIADEARASAAREAAEEEARIAEAAAAAAVEKHRAKQVKLQDELDAMHAEEQAAADKAAEAAIQRVRAERAKKDGDR